MAWIYVQIKINRLVDWRQDNEQWCQVFNVMIEYTKKELRLGSSFDKLADNNTSSIFK